MADSLPRILPAGTKVVLAAAAKPRGGGPDLPAGTAAVVILAPADPDHRYLVKSADGREAAVLRRGLRVLRREGAPPASTDEAALLRECVVYRVIVGSRAYGLSREDSDVDRRGVYLAPAALFFSLGGALEQIEDRAAEECFWELGKFVRLALKANPNVLECLWTSLVEHSTPVGDELRAMRDAFSSKLVYQTIGGYALSQFQKMERDLRNGGRVKWKHAMHLIRLLHAGAEFLRTGVLPLEMPAHRSELLAIRDGSWSFEEVDRRRRELHREFEAAYATTRLPDRPDFDRANEFVVRVRLAEAGR